MTREIKKVKVTKGRTVEVELVEHLDNGTIREVAMKCDQLAHDDLLVTMDKLRFHLVKLCELKEGERWELDTCDPETDLKNFKVTGFSIGGNDDSLGVTLIGQKILSSAKVLNLTSPFMMYADEVNPYDYASDLASDIEGCKYEAMEYLFNGKFAVKQLEIDFEAGDPDMEGGKVVEMATDAINPKRNRKKKEYSISVLGEDGTSTDITDILG